MADLKRLYHDLVRFETELWATLDARLKSECGLPLTWFEIMYLLQREPRQRVHDVAATFAITVGGVSKVIDKIEGAGFCRRVPNPEDRRSSLLELTSTGTACVDVALPVFEDELRLRFSSVLDDAGLEAVEHGLRLLRMGAFASREHATA
jgi:DNA-binding MarR family transcriptional regulator